MTTPLHLVLAQEAERRAVRERRNARWVLTPRGIDIRWDRR